MSRPLRTKGIEDLEELFKDATDDPKTLRRLAEELSCRSTARASSLFAAVQRALSAPGEPPSGGTEPTMREEIHQLTLLPGTPVPKAAEAPIVLPPARPLREPQTRASPMPIIPTKDSSPGRPSMDASSSSMTPEAAYRALKIGSSASWLTIENARREIVQKASPEALECEPESNRSAIVERAVKANEASASLWRERYPKLV